MSTVKGTNHLGERTVDSYGRWLAEMKKIDPNVRIEGDRDIANAFSSTDPKKAIGEWDGETGVIYNKSAKMTKADKDTIRDYLELGWPPSRETLRAFAGMIEQKEVSYADLDSVRNGLAKLVKDAQAAGWKSVKGWTQVSEKRWVKGGAAEGQVQGW